MTEICGTIRHSVDDACHGRVQILVFGMERREYPKPARSVDAQENSADGHRNVDVPVNFADGHQNADVTQNSVDGHHNGAANAPMR